MDSAATGPDASPTLLAVNVGLPADHEWSGGTVRTAIWKSPMTGPQRVNRLNIVGDEQADKLGHGGEHRAVMVYQIESYHHWQRHFGRDDFEYGQFGENFTVSGLADDEVCIGDRYRIGTAVFEVTQPRVTCYRVGIRLGVPTMAALLVEHRRPGFYFRVIEEGCVTPGDAVTRVSRPSDTLTVARTDGLLYLPGRAEEELRTAVGIPALSEGWRSSFQEILDRADATDDGAGWTGFLPLRIVDARAETDDIRSVVLAAPESGPPLPRAKAGQYLTIRVPSGADGATSVRNYSLSSAPGADHYRISVKRDDLGEVSRWLHVARTPAGRPFGDEAQALVRRLPNARAHTFYTAAGTAPAAAGESVHSGRPTGEALRALGFSPDTDAYVCGPPGFMTAMTAALRQLGLGAERVHSETFGASTAAGTGPSVPPHVPSGPPGQGPAITFAHSGLTVPYADRYRNLLDFTEACDVPVRWSCRTGVCHSCRTPLIAGSVDYHPQPLDPPGGADVLLCCAHPAGALVLDL